MIQMPDVENVMVDKENDVTYTVMAFRKLNNQEIVQAIQYYIYQKGGKKPRRGSRITIVTVLGHNA